MLNVIYFLELAEKRRQLLYSGSHRVFKIVLTLFEYTWDKFWCCPYIRCIYILELQGVRDQYEKGMTFIVAYFYFCLERLQWLQILHNIR